MEAVDCAAAMSRHTLSSSSLVCIILGNIASLISLLVHAATLSLREIHRPAGVRGSLSIYRTSVPIRPKTDIDRT